MSRINMGGPMPDGTRAQDLWVESFDFICASGSSLSEGLFKNILGKLCLTRASLVMLPYEGAMLQVAQQVASHLQTAILGPYAHTASLLQKFGLYPKNVAQVTEVVMLWPLASLEGDAQVHKGILGGAILNIKFKGKTYSFSLRSEGHQPAGFASAQTFATWINRLRHG
jgi:hypothetical protein